jgi:hypothetical protein
MKQRNNSTENFAYAEEKYKHLITKYEETEIIQTEEQLLTQEKQRRKEVQEEIRKQEAQERCLLLYEKGKIKNEVNKLLYEKNYDRKAQDELSRCTFKPFVLPPKNKLSTQNIQETKMTKSNKRASSIYNRNINWAKATNEKLLIIV